MNKETIAKNFEELVATRPEQFDSKLAAVVRAFLKAPSMYEKGESDCFDPILSSGCFTLATSPLFGGELKEAHRVRCAAAVLYGISLEIKNDSKQSLGWNTLNIDVRGFCSNLLKCELPSKISDAAVRELFTAKSLVGRLVDDAKLLPMEGREPLQRTGPSGMLGKPIDE